MKTKIQKLLTSFLAMICTNAIAAETCTSTTCPGTDDWDTYRGEHCNTNYKTCYKGTGSGTYRITYSCGTCPNDLHKISQTITECSNVTYSTCGCNAGYYVQDSKCTKCPTPGTSASDNTGGITSCYIPKGNYSDTTGIYTLNNHCFHDDPSSSSSSS